MLMNGIQLAISAEGKNQNRNIFIRFLYIAYYQQTQ